MLYAFILGKNTALSVAEILSVLKRDRFVFVIISLSRNTLVIKLDKSIKNVQEFLNKIGGTVKIVEIFDESNGNNIEDLILSFIKNSFQDSKFVFGISSYGLKTKNLGFEIKKELKKARISSRYVEGKGDQLSAPEIQNNKMIEKGADFVLIQAENKVFIGKTVAIQDYESYSYRDWERPRRNAKSGMLPPKVAQTMINLIPNSPNNLSLIYDPFCGNGTVLQEALLMGYKIIGSDISNGRVHDTKENLRWLGREYNIEVEPEKMVFQADALNLEEKDLPIKPDVIVSEVYLGPPLTEKENEQAISNIIKDLNIKYIDFLKNTYYALPTTSYLILALPFYILRNKRYFLNIFDEAKEISYNVIDPFDNSKVDLNLIPEFDSTKKTILYSRSDQIVGREIVILEKNN